MGVRVAMMTTVFLSSCCILSSGNKLKECDVERAILYAANIHTSTEYKITCTGFYDAFGNGVIDFEIKNSAKLKELCQMMNNSIEVNDPRVQNILDIRAIFYIYRSTQKIDTLCLTSMPWQDYYTLNGKPMQFPNKSLIKYVDSLYMTRTKYFR